MPTFLKDGTGTGNQSKVDHRNNLHVHSRSIALPRLTCQEGDGFLMRFGPYSITATGGRVAWLYWQELTKSIAIDKLFISWNGGSTSHNRVAQAAFYIGDTIPTGNFAASQLINTNTRSANTVSHTLYVWDGVGDGMTGMTPGVELSTLLLGQGVTCLPVDGVLLLGPATTISLVVIPEEAGTFACSVYGYTIDPAADPASGT